MSSDVIQGLAKERDSWGCPILNNPLPRSETEDWTNCGCIGLEKSIVNGSSTEASSIMLRLLRNVSVLASFCKIIAKCCPSVHSKVWPYFS